MGRRFASVILPLLAVVAAVTGVLLLIGKGERPSLSAPQDPLVTVTPAVATPVPTRPTAAPTTEPASPSPSASGPSSTPFVLPERGPGTFTFAPASGWRVGSPPYRPFSVGVEDGVGLDAAAVAAFVEETLADERSWIADGITGFERVDDGGDFRLVVASPETVDGLCAPLQTNGLYSCGRNGWIALNLHRWETASDSWPIDLVSYRRYLVNHEVGHYILGPDHEACPGPGELAPIMMQQTKGLDGCLPNSWPFPDRS